MRVAIIERGVVGGTCVNTGCIPTKTMVASAYAAHMVSRAVDFGVAISGSVATDMAKVKARKDAVSGESRSGVESWLENMEHCEVIRGHARFTGSHQIAVGELKLAAPRIFINVGGRASIPQIPGIDSVPYLTNSSMMRVDFLPEHLIILGGSYIALEFGQMFRRFGSRVTLIERSSRVAAREDPDVSAAILEIFHNENITVELNAKISRIKTQGREVIVMVDANGKQSAVTGSHLLLAVGRRPNTDDLGLDVAGIATDERGYIQVDDELRTNIEGVWALGDCNGKGAFTHTSYNDYEIVAANLLDHDHRKVSDRIPAYNLYIDPPLGRAGMNETKVRETGRKALVGKRPMRRVGRALEKGETQGFLKILVDEQTKTIFGASLLGTGCDEVIHSILDVMYARQPYTVITRAMHIHPTVSELIPTTLENLEPLS